MPVRAVCCCGVALLCFASLGLAQPPTFYVSPHGDDAWSGRLPQASTEKTDGPLATLERARDAIRALKSSGGLPEAGCIVELRGGVYELAKPFEVHPTKAYVVSWIPRILSLRNSGSLNP
ncbi:MAG: hypothetical protein HQ582_06940 [Planctomycetes bacterium]|nr:hypothetical protein [Planctomycetota bacterium]